MKKRVIFILSFLSISLIDVQAMQPREFQEMIERLNDIIRKEESLIPTLPATKAHTRIEPTKKRKRTEKKVQPNEITEPPQKRRKMPEASVGYQHKCFCGFETYDLEKFLEHQKKHRLDLLAQQALTQYYQSHMQTAQMVRQAPKPAGATPILVKKHLTQHLSQPTSTPTPMKTYLAQAIPMPVPVPVPTSAIKAKAQPKRQANPVIAQFSLPKNIVIKKGEYFVCRVCKTTKKNYCEIYDHIFQSHYNIRRQ